MRRPPQELLISGSLILVLAAIYGYLARSGPLPPSGLIGMTLGCVGLTLMLGAEFLYSWRKTTTRMPWGPTRNWLKWHIVLGLVGPWMALLHSGGKFGGLAGVTAGFTIAIVVSGFVGRFFYTAVPRTLDGSSLGIQELEQAIRDNDHRLMGWNDFLGMKPPGLLGDRQLTAGWKLILGRSFVEWSEARAAHKSLSQLILTAQQRRSLEQLLMERVRLRVHVAGLARNRQIFALWHLFHVPLGAVLFTLALVHVIAAWYYAF